MIIIRSLPFFGNYKSATNSSLVDVNGNTPAAMSQELKLAKQYGVVRYVCMPHLTFNAPSSSRV